MGDNLSFIVSAIDKASSVFGRIKGSVVGLVSTYFSLRTVSSQVAKAIDYADQVQDMAEATGLSASAFQALSVAAKEAGSSQEQMIAIMMKIKSAQADIGSNKANQGYFSNMGLSVEAVKKAQPAQLLQAIADRMKQAGGAADVFGLMGERLGPRVEQVLKKISDVRLDGLVKSMQEAGQVMSDLDVQRLSEAKDSLDRLGTSITIAVGGNIGDWQSMYDRSKESPDVKRYRQDSEEYGSFNSEERKRGRQILKEKGFENKDINMDLLMTAYRVARKQINEENTKAADAAEKKQKQDLQKKELASFRLDLSIRDAEIGARRVLLREKLRQLKSEQALSPEKSTELEKKIAETKAEILRTEKEISDKAKERKESKDKEQAEQAKEKAEQKKQADEARAEYLLGTLSESKQITAIEKRMKDLRKSGTDADREEFYKLAGRRDDIKKSMAERLKDAQKSMADMRVPDIKSVEVSALFDRMYAGGTSRWNKQDSSLIDYARKQAEFLKIIADNSQGVR
jgi:hypothetical protein